MDDENLNQNQSYELQEVKEGSDSSPSYSSSGDLAPVYFMMGFIAGILFVNLFKGRWFL